MIAMAAKRNAGGDQRLMKRTARGHAQALVVQIGTVALLRREHLIGDGIVDDGGDELFFPLQRNRNGEMRQAMKEIRRAIERIDDEAVRFVGALDHARLLDEKGVTGPRFRKLLNQNALRAFVS